ncbi:hypothetical protein [Streptomyces sp. 7N604]|uniref:hypothetical protein n=1 Tax=Streptomyces sp. 7N604 TaxID=3457415 RepID=UPI003FD5F5DB
MSSSKSTRGSTGRAQCCQRRVVDAVQQAPGGRGGGHRAEDPGLVAQQGQVGDGFAAVGEHHAILPGLCAVPRGCSRLSASVNAPVRPVPSAISASRRDPAWLMTAL